MVLQLNSFGAENPGAVYDYRLDRSFWKYDPSDHKLQYNYRRVCIQLPLQQPTVHCVARTREIQVNESIIATITDNDVTIVDDSDNNSITIDPSKSGNWRL